MDTADVAVGADIARSLGYDGTGVGVAVIDSGVNTINDLGAPATSHTRVVYSANFDTSSSTTSDSYGHGTHVAGIIAGNAASSSCGNCDVPIRGIAPNANIVNLRVLDANGQATDSEVIAAIQQAISLKDTYNIRVINLSLGRGVFESYTTDPLCQAVEQAWNAGIVTVVAGGNYGRDNSNNNNGYGTITAPGNDPYVITVGAMKTMGTKDRADDLIATYSSKGPSMLDHVVKHAGSLRAVGGDQVVSPVFGAHGLHSAHGDHVGIVARRGDGAIAVVVGVVAAVVAGGHNRDDARVPRLLDCLA